MAETSRRRNEYKHLVLPFINHLLQRGILSAPQVTKALKLQSEIDVRLGQLAVLKGYLKPRDAYLVVAEMLDASTRFGDVAVGRGLMTAEQVEELMKVQRSPFLLFLESVTLCGLVGADVLHGHVQGFLREVRPLAGLQTTPLDAHDDLRRRVLSAREAKPGEEQVFKTLRKVRSLATLPQVVERVLALLANPDVTLAAVGKVIQADPALSAQLLRLANSAFFGLRGKVSTVDRVMVTFGIGGVRQFVLASALIDRFRRDDDEARVLWRHAVQAGQWARALAGRMGAKEEPAEAFTAGLVHDMGKLVLLQYFPREHEAVLKLAREGVPRLQAEREALGIAHPDMGAYLCHFWGFPEGMCQAVLYHHASAAMLQTVPELEPLARVVNAACRIANQPFKENVEVALANLEEEFLLCHGLDPGTLAGLAPGVLRDTEELVNLLL